MEVLACIDDAWMLTRLCFVHEENLRFFIFTSKKLFQNLISLRIVETETESAFSYPCSDVQLSRGLDSELEYYWC
jgi:hypothetical protein